MNKYPEKNPVPKEHVQSSVVLTGVGPIILQPSQVLK